MKTFNSFLAFAIFVFALLANTAFIASVSHAWDTAALGIGVSALIILLAVLIARLSPMWPGYYRWVWMALLWGSVIATSLPLLVSEGIEKMVRATGWDAAYASFAGAYPEELAKALGIYLVLIISPWLCRPWHGLLVGAFVGLGFDVYENILYGLQMGIFHPNADIDGAIETWTARLLLGPLLHMVLSAFEGYGMGLALYLRENSIIPALRWWAIAFILHFLWNYNYGSVFYPYILISLVVYPLFVTLWVRNHRAARRDYGVLCVPQLSRVSDLATVVLR